jgi:hypothetical protein
MRCACVDKATGLVINTIVAELTDPAPDHTYFIEIPEGVIASIGWTWNGTQFIDPNPPVPEVEEII